MLQDFRRLYPELTGGHEYTHDEEGVINVLKHMGQYFIIKADDLKYNHLSKNWVEFLNVLNKYKIPAALELIGKSLEINKGKEYNSRFKELISNHELFCHGYLHCLNEYVDRNLEDQRNSILKSIEIIKKILNYSPCTFGAPGNNFSKNTRKVLT